MATRPTNLPTWTSDTARFDRPDVGKRTAGYADRERPSAKGFNGVLHELGEWVEWLDDTHVQYHATLEDVHAQVTAGTLATGEGALVKVTSVARGTAVLATLTTAPTGVAADTRYVYSNQAALMRALDDSGANAWTTAPSASGTLCATDGLRVALTNNAGLVYVRTVAAGTAVAQTTANLGASPTGIDIRGGLLAVCGALTSGTDAVSASLRLYNATTGALQWTYNDTSTYDVALHGEQLWATGNAGPSTFNVRRWATSSATPEQVNSGIYASDYPTTARAAHDGTLLYVASLRGSSGANTLLALDPQDLSRTIWSVGAGSTLGYTALCVDHRHVYAVRTGESIVRAFDKATGVQVDQVTVASGIVAIASDGQFVYVAATGGGNRVHRVRLGSDRARIWTVADTTDTFRPHGWSLIPES
jgi:hypothetical protein